MGFEGAENGETCCSKSETPSNSQSPCLTAGYVASEKVGSAAQGQGAAGGAPQSQAGILDVRESRGAEVFLDLLHTGIRFPIMVGREVVQDVQHGASPGHCGRPKLGGWFPAVRQVIAGGVDL